MDCAEFQKVLPHIIESGGNPQEDSHLKHCPVCSDLVQDLRYIAEQAKLLLPMHDPSPRVWQGIRRGLQQEGLVPSSRALAPAATLNPLRWGTLAQAGALAALLLMTLALFTMGDRGTPRETTIAAESAAPAPPAADVDVQLLASISERTPASRETYAASLAAVNDYIRDARKTLDERPDDEVAREHLMHAYEQKSMLYEMALSQSLN